MADGDDPLAGGSYSQLLFADDDNVVSLAISDGLFGPNNSSVSTQKPPKMLCFGGDYQQHKQRECDFGFPPPQRTTQKSGITCSDSSSTSSINNARIKKKRKGYGDDAAAAQNLITTGTGAPAGSQRSSNKIKSEKSATGNGHAKVKFRKEKLGERISALQQLVSPYGKSDTASVLHEATGYIKFLHDQVQVLCSPYLQCLPSSNQAQLLEGGGSGVSGSGQEGVGTGENESINDFRSRGLCLVPVGCTVHMASNNGADFWSPSARGKNVSSAQR